MTVPRVLFGSGTIGEVGSEVERLGGTRAVVLSGPTLAAPAARVGELLGPVAVGAFGGAAMHTPVGVTEQALATVRTLSADCLVAVGGGSTVGLSKALALRTDLPQVVLPTTYAGSEVTSVLGQTVLGQTERRQAGCGVAGRGEDERGRAEVHAGTAGAAGTSKGRKTTLTSPAVLPETVIYDVDLTLGLPVPLSVTSGMNAFAHAVEALYAPQANPITEGLALDAIARLADGLPAIAADPGDREARTDLLYAAYLAGTCLASVGMGLHHKLCHVLGGSFGLPHAATHTVVLPYAMAYNAPAVPDVMDLVAGTIGATEAPGGVYDLVVGLGGPVSLRELGLAAGDLGETADLAGAAPVPNPREVTGDGVLALLRAAWSGQRPARGE